MRNIIKTLALVAVAAMTLIACQKEINPQMRNADGLYKYSFSVVEGEAKIDAETKAAIGDGNIEWVANDQVGVFIGSTSNYAKMDVSTEPVMAILYSNAAIPQGTMAYGYFPYNEANKTEPYSNEMALIHFSATQSGAASSAMPLAGVPFEVQEEIDPKATEGNGELKFLNLGSLVVFKIWSANADEQAETIQYVELEGNEATLAGDAVLDLTAVDPSNAESLAVTFVENEEPSVKVNQIAAVASSKDGATPVKMVIAPGSFSSTLKICTDAHTYYFELASKTYNRSGMRTFGVNLANAVSKEGVDLDAVKLPYEESFATDQGDFTIDNIVDLPSGLSAVWTHSNQGGSYMKATAYENSRRYETESMLVSPWINLVDIAAAEVTFDHAVNYTSKISDKSAYLSFWVKTDDQGSSWQKLTIPNYGTGTSWNFVASGPIDITDYCGKNVQLAFKYISGGTSDDTPTWEIKNFIVDVKKVDCGLTYGEKDHFELVLGSEDYNEWTAPEIGNPHSLLDITYASNDEDVAVVDEGTGAVTLQGASGTAVITASFAGDAQYNPGSASYTIKVIDPTATTVTDVLNLALTGVSGSSYADWSGKTSNSDAVYAGNSAGSNDAIQLRSKNSNSGIVSTTSGGYVRTVTIKWNDNTDATRTIDIYGNNTAYTTASNLYGNSTQQGSLLGSLCIDDASDDYVSELVVSGDYKYIGIRSKSGALYIDEIDIEWSSEAAPVTLSSIAVSGQTTVFNVGDTFAFGGTVTATYSDGTTANVTSSALFSGYDMSAAGNQTVTVSYTENGIEKITTYSITVKNNTGGSTTASFIFNTDAGIAELGISKPSTGAGTSLEGPYTIDGVTMAVTHGTTDTRVWNSQGTLDLRIYKSGGSLAFSVPSGKTIKNIELSGSAVNIFSATEGSFSNGTWTGSENSVTLTATSTGKINTIAVTYE